MNIGYVVTERIDGAHPLHPWYPLLPGDLLLRNHKGTYAKEAPGLGVFGFVLTPEQEATLKETPFSRYGLEYAVLERDDDDDE